MNRIEKTFIELKKENRTAFIPYITAGDPDISTTKKIVKELVASGADIIELGVPFSDPLADGPVIQRAIERALKGGCSVKKIFKMVSALREDITVPLVFMTYYNIVFNYGVERFVKDSVKSGADGIIVPDLPMEEASELKEAALKHDFCVIMLTAPTTPYERFREIASFSSGFIYYVSLTGVTGVRKDLSSKLRGELVKLKKLTDKPVCVGFGVSTPHQARELAGTADGVIVGSAIIKELEKSVSDKLAMPGRAGKIGSSLARAVHKG